MATICSGLENHDGDKDGGGNGNECDQEVVNENAQIRMLGRKRGQI
jgi:hypothetical protein